jgi:hypothetical protein
VNPSNQGKSGDRGSAVGVPYGIANGASQRGESIQLNPADQFTLAYGYAVSAQQPASQWASNSVSECAAWRLKKTSCFLIETSLVALGEQLLIVCIRLSTKDGDLEISA